jgi:hypothetical protein
MASQGSNSSTTVGNQNETTIDDLATAAFVNDIRRVLGVVGCTPQCAEDWGVCEPMDAAHDFVTAGPCFEPSENGNSLRGDDKSPGIPTKIEVMFGDGENDTVISETVYSGSAYESFREFVQPQAAMLTKCSKCFELDESH